jgi:hypothetical protein
VRIPCVDVYSSSECNLAASLKRDALLQQEVAKDKALIASGASPAAIQQAAARLQAESENATGPTTADIRNGLEVSSANCTGTGSPDKSGYRFRQFRCVVIVTDLGSPVAHGRLNVVVTGKTTFHWQVI